MKFTPRGDLLPISRARPRIFAASSFVPLLAAAVLNFSISSSNCLDVPLNIVPFCPSISGFC